MLSVQQMSIPALANRLGTEADAYAFLEDLRWNGTPACPHCDATDKLYFLKPANGLSRKTRTGMASQRRVWKCGTCRNQFSVLTGTIFHGTKISLRTWLFVIFEMCASKNGVSAREIERKYELTAKSAWFMLHRIREAMKREPLVGMLKGTVVADETFIGGKPRNKHQQGRPARLPGRGPGGQAHLTPVLSLVSKETGEVRSRIVPKVTGDSLRQAMADQLDPATTTLHTDSSPAYRGIAREFALHEFVDHSRYEYVRGEVTTNHAEGYFSQLKRSLDGTHHHVSVEHLDRYLAEFDYRYSTRTLSDTRRVGRLMGQVGGRRLTYRPLTGR